MTAANTLPVWPDHRGDDVAVTVALARDQASIEEAQQSTHDFIIEQVGDRRAGPVVWSVHPPGDGLQIMRDLDMEVTREIRRFLRLAPDPFVVFAMAATDAPAEVSR